MSLGGVGRPLRKGTVEESRVVFRLLSIGAKVGKEEKFTDEDIRKEQVGQSTH